MKEPQRPEPPLNRHILDSIFVIGFCDLCGSSIKRKWLIFGEKYCIHPQCKKSSYNLIGNDK